jgi:hypothetical protein
VDLEPPYPLTLPARRHWDRLAKQIHGQGRWDVISHDLLANFCQLLALSQECLSAILADGVWWPGPAVIETALGTRCRRRTRNVRRT